MVPVLLFTAMLAKILPIYEFPFLITKMKNQTYMDPMTIPALKFCDLMAKKRHLLEPQLPFCTT